MSIGHWLNRPLQVWRPATEPDGAGGQTTTYVRQEDDVTGKVDQPSVNERLLAQQAQSEHTHNIYLLPGADVRRGDELRDGTTGEVWRVMSVVGPSSTRYRKCEAQLIQSEGETNG